MFIFQIRQTRFARVSRSGPHIVQLQVLLKITLLSDILFFSEKSLSVCGFEIQVSGYTYVMCTQLRSSLDILSQANCGCNLLEG